MRLFDYTLKLLGLSAVIHRWRDALKHVAAERREKVAAYADSIAATLGRAAGAFAALESRPGDRRAAGAAVRELGRITGYVEDIVATLEDHLDGRKLAGVKRRLEQLAGQEPIRLAIRTANGRQVERLLEAEGYFRALADGLRA